jgi:hypothetical protein
VTILDLILNLVGLLLWLGWRALRLSDASPPKAISLASTLRRAEAQPTRSWLPLIWLAGLLAARSILYWQMGPAQRWIPTLEFGAIALPFRADLWPLMLLYSLLSFLKLWLVFHLWLLFLAILHRHQEAGPIQALVDAQLGVLACWPRLLQVLLVPVAIGLLWWGSHPLLVWIGLLSSSSPASAIWIEGLAIGLGACLSWQYPALVVLAVHLLHNYVYVGEVASWNYAAACGRSLARPLGWLPSTFGRFDLRPLLGIGLVIVLGHFGRLGVTWLFQQRPL